MNKSKNNHFEKKSSSFEIKQINNLGKFCGYASVFNIKDSYNDIVLPQAFKKTLLSKNFKTDIKMLWQHQVDKPIGYFTLIKEDSIGLYVEGQIMLNVEKGMEAYNLIKSKAVNGLSIGYKVNDYDYDEKSQVRKLKEIELFEISIVTFPANEYSNITYCKNKNSLQDILIKLNNLKNILNNM